MNLTINNGPTYTAGYKYTVKGSENKKVTYLYNQVKALISGKGIPATFQMGPEDKIVLSPASKTTAHSIKKDLKRAGIKISRKEFIG